MREHLLGSSRSAFACGARSQDDLDLGSSEQPQTYTSMELNNGTGEIGSGSFEISTQQGYTKVFILQPDLNGIH